MNQERQARIKSGTRVMEMNTRVIEICLSFFIGLRTTLSFQVQQSEIEMAA